MIKKQIPKLKIIPLGGLEEIGRNMVVLECDKDIIIVDMGLQFPEEDMPGIDYIIPNISYLRKKENYIRGVIITHGHYDHIGAIPHLISKLGNPTIFTTKLTRGIIEKRQEDFETKEKLNIYTVSPKDILRLGCFKIEFFRVNHNIPDSCGLFINTPVGLVVHTGDFKFDPAPVNEKPMDLDRLSKIGLKGVLVLLSDSTNADVKGHQKSEKEIGETLKNLFQQAKQRIIVATFASLLSRIQQIIWLAEEFGRKVAIDGYSMKTNVAIAQKLGYLKIRKGTLINIKEANKLSPDRIIVLCTGAQGEERAVLMRIANREHRYIKIEKGDTLIFSSSVVPGNERTVQRLKDSLTRQGAEIVDYEMMDVHASGHAYAEDLKRMITLLRPKYFIPIEANHYKLKKHADIAKKAGVNLNNIFLADNGQIIEFASAEKGYLTRKKVPSDYVMVDGLGLIDANNVILRDRKMLAADGMFVVIVTVDSKSGKLVLEPDIISRGFVYMKASKALINQTKRKVKQILAIKEAKSSPNYVYIKNKIRDDIGQFLYSKTQRRPMILPVVVEV